MKKKNTKNPNNNSKLVNFLLENNLKFEITNNEQTKDYFAFVNIPE